MQLGGKRKEEGEKEHRQLQNVIRFRQTQKKFFCSTKIISARNIYIYIHK